MKKTLAAVLAAAMALSTATVAFAVDDPDLPAGLWGTDGSDDIADILYGIDVVRNIHWLGEGESYFDGYDLADLVDNGFATVTPIVTDGASKLSSKPSITPKRVVRDTVQSTTVKKVYTWNWTILDADGKVIVKKGTTVGDIPVYDDGGWQFITDGTNNTDLFNPGTDPNVWQLKNFYKKDVDWVTEDFDKKYTAAGDTKSYAQWLSALNSGAVQEIEKHLVSKTDKDNLLQLKFTVKDTYGTGDDTIGLKLRVTIKKDVKDDDGNILYKKGNTYTTEEYRYKASYNEIAAHAEDMQVTLQEVKDRCVILKGDKLYDEVGNGQFNISFGDDVAMFVGKGSSSQKKVNLFYNLDEDAELTAMYPDVDFEFIEFKGTPSFVNSGSLVFKAENKNYTVYEWDGEGWTPLDGRSTFDPTYKTVTVKNVKKLTKYAIASDVLPVEDEEPEEPAEPVDSTPVAEPDDEGENPNTGAC